MLSTTTNATWKQWLRRKWRKHQFDLLVLAVCAVFAGLSINVIHTVNRLKRDTVTMECRVAPGAVIKTHRRMQCREAEVEILCRNDTVPALLVFPALRVSENLGNWACRTEDSDVEAWEPNPHVNFEAHVYVDRPGGTRAYRQPYNVWNIWAWLLTVCICGYLFYLWFMYGKCQCPCDD